MLPKFIDYLSHLQKILLCLLILSYITNKFLVALWYDICTKLYIHHVITTLCKMLNPYDKIHRRYLFNPLKILIF